MNIIDEINQKVTELTALGLTDTDKVRNALTMALTMYPNRHPRLILQQAAVALLNNHLKGA